MRKKLLSASLWGILTLSLFYSCRTDSATTEQTITSKAKIAAFERFEKENNIIKPVASNDQSTSSSKYVSYAYPFAQIIYNFLQAHPDYAKKVENEAGTIRLDAVSQTFGDAKKAVIFPVTNNEGKVIAAWAGVVNENRDYVDFYYLNGNSDNVTTIKTAFQNYYDQKKTKQLASIAVASTKGINPIALAPTPPPVVPVVDINEVHITVPPPDLTISSSAAFGAGSINYGNTLGGGMSGSSTTHGGGSGGSTPNANQEIINNLKDYPCAQNLLEKLPNLNNDLAKLIKEALGENNKDIQVNFFGETFADPDLQGETRKVSKIGDVITKYDIALSDAMLKRSTQEYILATMYHEFIHAYLGYEFIQLKADAYHAKYPYLESYIVGGERKFKFIIGDHQAYTPFVNMIADAIQSFNPSFPRDRAISLAMEGLTDDGLPLLNQSYNKSERQGDFLSKGTKCSK